MFSINILTKSLSYTFYRKQQNMTFKNLNTRAHFLFLKMCKLLVFIFPVLLVFFFAITSARTTAVFIIIMLTLVSNCIATCITENYVRLIGKGWAAYRQTYRCNLLIMINTTVVLTSLPRRRGLCSQY